MIVTIKSHRSGYHHQSHNHYGDLHSQELMNNFHWGHTPSPNYLSIWLSDLMIYAQNNMLMSFESRFSFKLPFWEISSEVVAVLARKHDKLSGNLLQSLSQPLKLETAFPKSSVQCTPSAVHT